ncbi:uncharacterized protein LOC133698321 isoform X2 [Populus nigra]|uniref:uncharacterized protein LOC133698321 isoform X2 n=1 Tax=Populus nigra TaxID=3691 RepID=UPI002B26C1F9|nr:uncharacterized protein LOC133698321 isoform X2 [Populus nigra]
MESSRRTSYKGLMKDWLCIMCGLFEVSAGISESLEPPDNSAAKLSHNGNTASAFATRADAVSGEKEQIEKGKEPSPSPKSSSLISPFIASKHNYFSSHRYLSLLQLYIHPFDHHHNRSTLLSLANILHPHKSQTPTEPSCPHTNS